MVRQAKENTVTVRTVIVAPVANFIKLQQLREKRNATVTIYSRGLVVGFWEIIRRVRNKHMTLGLTFWIRRKTNPR